MRSLYMNMHVNGISCTHTYHLFLALLSSQAPSQLTSGQHTQLQCHQDALDISYTESAIKPVKDCEIF